MKDRVTRHVGCSLITLWTLSPAWVTSYAFTGTLHLRLQHAIVSFLRCLLLLQEA